MGNHDLDPKLYDVLVESGIIDPNKPERPTEEYVTSSDSKQARDRQHRVYVLYESNPLQLVVWVLLVIFFSLLALGWITF